jgi:hypothetical protein
MYLFAVDNEELSPEAPIGEIPFGYVQQPNDVLANFAAMDLDDVE